MDMGSNKYNHCMCGRTKFVAISSIILCTLWATALTEAADTHPEGETFTFWSARPYLDTITTPGLVLDIPTTTALKLNLRECIDIALKNNFSIINERRDLEIQVFRGGG